eukprot:3423192-Amphidinium_carterae.1
MGEGGVERPATAIVPGFEEMAWMLRDHGINLEAASKGRYQCVGAWILDTLATVVEVELGWKAPS